MNIMAYGDVNNLLGFGVSRVTSSFWVNYIDNLCGMTFRKQRAADS